MGKARTNSRRDPVKKLATLGAANRMPVFINNNAELSAATTLMLLHNYSQLPVVNNMSRPIPIGFISWETIGKCSSRHSGQMPLHVKDCVEKDLVAMSADTPILDAIGSIYKHDFIVVVNPDETLAGIVTAADISAQFLTNTEPFLLLEEIECHVRQILDGKLMLEELCAFCDNGEGRELASIDDLNFGDYISVMSKDEVWGKLEMSIDKKYFLRGLDVIREIRNDIMHFDPEGVSEAEMTQLRNMSKFLAEVGRGVSLP
jgi:CBS domain-containing protein